jgi:hypothetical protein|tara:strand:+ start:676 stop:1887 length:1212 start_codon:yes stop_codon:yes gene_type:complete
MAWNDASNMGSAFPLMDYGANKLAGYVNNQLPNNQNNSGLAWYQNADRSRYRNPNPMMPGMLDQTGQMGASNYQAPNTLDPNWQHQLRLQGMQQNAPEESTGILENFKNKLKGFTTPTMAFMKMMAGERSPEKQAAYDAITGGKSLGTGQWTRGMYGGNEYDLYNSRSGLKVGSDILGRGEGFEKNFDSAFGSKSLEEMEQKKLDWAMNRVNKGKAISQRLRNVLTARGLMGGNIGDQRPGRTIDTTTTAPGTGGSTSGGYTGPRTYSFDRAAFQRSGGNRADKAGGFTDPGRGSYGPHRAEGGRMAYGGRAGYQGGELVEDASMVEATPAGMMEENVERVQKEPSREQLEAIALEIFKQPLEQLNEEQLMVVYQAAMEQEPSEEETQFAAQEGPGEGIASLV